MKKNIIAKIIAVLLFALATFFGVLASPVSASKPKTTSDYYSIKISDKNFKIMRPALNNKDCSNLTLGGVNIVMDSCAGALWWRTHTFYFYIDLGKGDAKVADLPFSDSSSTKVRAAWTKVRDFYGQFLGISEDSKAGEKNGFHYINCKLNSKSSSCALYATTPPVDFCKQNPTDPTCIVIPPIEPPTATCPPLEGDNLIVTNECASPKTFIEIEYLITYYSSTLIPGASSSSGRLLIPKKITLDTNATDSMKAGWDFYYAWLGVRDYYGYASKNLAGADQNLVDQSYQTVAAALSKVDTSKFADIPAGPNDRCAEASTTYEKSSSTTYPDGVFYYCNASKNSAINLYIPYIKSVSGTAQYYLDFLNKDEIQLPALYPLFAFAPTDQTKEISAWNAVADAYTEIMGSANALSNTSDATAAQTSITNIRASIATGSKIAFTVSSDEKYFIVDQAYIASTIPPQYTNYLKTVDLLKYPYSDSGPLTAGVLRDVSAAAVPVVANDLQAEALTNAQNLYLAIRNAAPANDKVNYDFAEHARINLAAAVQKYRDQQSTLDDGNVLVVPDSATVDQGDAVKITFSYVNDAVDSQLRFKVYVSDKDESNWLDSPHHVENFPAGVSGDYTFDWTWQTTTADTAITKHLIRADVWAIDTGAEVAQIATGSAEVTVLIEGQSDVKWSFDPSQEIKLGTSVKISYTITGHDNQTGQLYIKDCDDIAFRKNGENGFPITSGTTYSFTWDTATSGTESCNHKLGLTMGPTALSNSCIEVYPADGEPAHSCVGADGVPVTPPPTGATTEVNSQDFLDAVALFLHNDIKKPLKATTVRAFLIMVIEYWFPLLIGFASFIGIVVGGLQYISSEGDTAKAEKAKKTLLYSVVGIVLAILSVVIVQAVIGQINKDFK